MSECAHHWLACERTAGAVCSMCGATMPYTAMMRSYDELAEQARQAMIEARAADYRLRKQLEVPPQEPKPRKPDFKGWRREEREHKPSIVCARKGCERCIEEGERIYEQLAQHREVA